MTTATIKIGDVERQGIRGSDFIAPSLFGAQCRQSSGEDRRWNKQRVGTGRGREGKKGEGEEVEEEEVLMAPKSCGFKT